MPSTSPKQAKLMRAVAHGWKPNRIDGPSVSVAKEFVAADRLAEMYEGGLAPMNDIIQRGFAPSLHMQGGGEVWTPYGPGQDYGDIPEETLKFLNAEIKGNSRYAKMMRRMQEKGRVQYGYNPPAVAAPTATATPVPVTTVRPRGGSGRRGRNGGGRRQRDGDGGGGRPPRTGPPPGVEGDPPAVTPIPPRDRRAGRDTEYSAALRAHKARVAQSLAVPPGGYAGGGQVNYYDEGGVVRPGHAEDATGGPNPYPHGTASYNYWESRKHVDPPPPEVVEAEPAEDLSWLDRLLGRGEDIKTRSERELEALGEAHGGYIDVPGYQFGGLAQANFRGPPRGGVSPRVGMMNPRGGIPPGGAGGRSGMLSQLRRQAQSQRGGAGRRGFPPRAQIGGPGGMPGRVGTLGGPGYGPNPLGSAGPGGSLRGGGGFPPGKGPRMQVPPSPPRGMPFGGRDPRAMPPQGGGFPPGKGPRPMVPPSPPRGIPSRGMPPQGGGIPFGGRDPRAMPPQGGAGPVGGPKIAPNMRGYLQKQRMMNRPPANVGGGVNRVGQQDQQGGLARALQRGTGRPPMSRRGGFGRAR